MHCCVLISIVENKKRIYRLLLCFFSLFTGRNQVVAKVIFLHLFVILFTGGGCLSQCMLGYHPHPPRSRHTPPGSRHPPQSRHSPGADTPSPEQTPPGADTPPQQNTPHPPPKADTPSATSPTPEADTPPPPPGSRLRHTVNERPVRILLECILVSICN